MRAVQCSVCMSVLLAVSVYTHFVVAGLTLLINVSV